MAAKSINKPPIKDEISLHKKGWIIQRIGWVLILVFLISALLGLFGEGPLSTKKFRQGNVTVEFERFGRYEHGTRLRLQSDGENIGSVGIQHEYLKGFRVVDIIPEPHNQMALAGSIQYQFEGSENKVVTFYLQPMQRKTIEGVIQVNNSPSFTIKQTIYP